MNTYQILKHMTDTFLGLEGLDDEAVKEIANGCGPKSRNVVDTSGTWFKKQLSKIKCKVLGRDWIPDDFLGLDISSACNRHDCAYHFGETDDDKRIADLIFLNDMIILNQKDKGEPDTVKALRLNIIMKYYAAVSFYGHNAFWANKEKEKEE